MKYDRNRYPFHNPQQSNNPQPRRRISDARYPLARFIFRALVLAVMAATIYNVAMGALA